MQAWGMGMVLVLPLAATTATAQEAWRALSGSEIREALTDRQLQYETAWQEFRASGRTHYKAGQDSWGYWRVTENQYCSQWPPSDLWACYDVERTGARLRFVGTGGDVTEAEYAD